MNKKCNVRKILRDLAMTICSCLLTFMFFLTNFQHTYNACVIAFIFVLFEICIYCLYNKRTAITRRGMAVTAACGFILSITSLVGTLTENEQLHFLQTFEGGIRSFFFLFVRTILLSMLNLCLFIKLEEISAEKATECRDDLWNRYVRGGAK